MATPTSAVSSSFMTMRDPATSSVSSSFMTMRHTQDRLVLPSNVQDCACLIMDSNEQVQRLVHNFLVSLGLKHTQVEDVEHAVLASSQYDYGLIFVDLDKDGLTAAQNIRLQGKNRNTAIIGWVSSENQAAAELAATTAGITVVVVKPFSKDMLYEAIVTHGNRKVSKMEVLDVSNMSNMMDINGVGPASSLFFDLVVPRTARVLVVEDCSMTQHIVTGLLKRLTDVPVAQAFDGDQAFTLCSSVAFDIIFMDIQMPKVNGLVATHHIRQSCSLNQFTPIIAFTSTGSLDQFRVYGVDDLLPKPFTEDTLRTVFDRWTPFAQSALAPAQTPPAGTPGPTPSPLDFPLGKGPTSPLAVPVTATPTIAGNAGTVVVSSGAPSITPTKSSDVFYQQLSSPDPAAADSAAAAAASSGKAHATTRSGGNKTATGPFKKKPSMGHTAKEKLRRANIVHSCNAFRDLVPCVRDKDKAACFRISVEYVKFLRNRMPREMLQELDREFENIQANAEPRGLEFEESDDGE